MRADRARRRREARSKIPVLIAGDGVVAAELGDRFEARPAAQLPPKLPGAHRWIATAAYVVTVADAVNAADPEHVSFLDRENLFSLAIGCWGCEQPLGVIDATSRCPASGDS